MSISLSSFLMAVLLAIPAPGPGAASADDQAVVEILKSPKHHGRAGQSKRRRPADPALVLGENGAGRPNSVLPEGGWSPRRFSRPPPSL